MHASQIFEIRWENSDQHMLHNPISLVDVHLILWSLTPSPLLFLIRKHWSLAKDSYPEGRERGRRQEGDPRANGGAWHWQAHHRSRHVIWEYVIYIMLGVMKRYKTMPFISNVKTRLYIKKLFPWRWYLAWPRLRSIESILNPKQIQWIKKYMFKHKFLVTVIGRLNTIWNPLRLILWN